MNLQRLLYQNIIWRGFFFVSSFLLNIAIVRHFKADETGNLYYFISVCALIVLLLSLSFEAAIVYFASSVKIEISRLFNLSLLWVIISAVITAAAIFIFKGYLESRMLFWKIIFGIVFTCGNLLVNFISSFFYAEKKFLLPNLVGIIINIFLIVLIFLARKITWLNDYAFIAIYFSTFLLQGITMTLIFLKNIRPFKLLFPTMQQLKQILSYCVPVFASNVLMFFVYRIDYWFVHYYRSADELGNYIQVSKIAQMFFVLPGILAGVVFPVTAGGDVQQVHERLAILSRSLLLLYGIICIFLIAFGYWIFPFVFGESFHLMYLAFVCIVPGILALSTLYTLTAYYAGKNKVMVNVTGTMLALLVIIAGDWIFIPMFGINAAALVSSAGYLAYHIYVLLYFQKENHSPVNDFYTFRFSDLAKMKDSVVNYLNTSVTR